MTCFPAEIRTAILGAVPCEVEPLFDLLEGGRSFGFAGQTFRAGTYHDRPLLIGSTGLGKVNAALTTSALLEHFNISEVWNVGCAGSYAGSPLAIGDVLVTDRALCGDEGILTAQGILSAQGIGIPLLVRGEERYYDYFPLDRDPVFGRIREKTPAGLYRLGSSMKPEKAEPCSMAEGLDARGGETGFTPFRLHFGSSLTVGMVSGDARVAHERSRRFTALAENMEGSAVAQTCFRFEIPVLECRGISNIAGDRCKEHWRLREAVAHCHGIVLNWLD